MHFSRCSVFKKTNVMSVFHSREGNMNSSKFHLGVKCFAVSEVNDDAWKGSVLGFVNGHCKSKFKRDWFEDVDFANL